MRSLLAALCLALALSIACASPAFARSVSAAFEIPAPGHERVSVGFDTGRGTIHVETEDGTAYQEADYTAPAEITGRHFQVDLGPYGAVDVRFRPKIVAPEPAPGPCRTKFRAGVFVGTATYAGVPGAPAVSVSRSRGQMLSARGECSVHVELRDRRSRQAAARTRHETTLIAVTRRSAGPPPTLFKAQTPRSGATPSLLAAQYAREGSVKISRLTFGQSQAGAFTYDAGLSVASIAGTAPFSGSGQYTSNGDLRSWTGDLAVELLGDERVSLAGAQFKPHLFRTFPDKLAQLARYAGK